MYINLQQYSSNEQHRAVVLSAIVKSGAHGEQVVDSIIEEQDVIVHADQVAEFVVHNISWAFDEHGDVDGVDRSNGFYTRDLAEALEQYRQRRQRLERSQPREQRDPALVKATES